MAGSCDSESCVVVWGTNGAANPMTGAGGRATSKRRCISSPTNLSLGSSLPIWRELPNILRGHLGRLSYSLPLNSLFDRFPACTTIPPFRSMHNSGACMGTRRLPLVPAKLSLPRRPGCAGFFIVGDRVCQQSRRVSLLLVTRSIQGSSSRPSRYRDGAHHGVLVFDSGHHSGPDAGTERCVPLGVGGPKGRELCHTRLRR